jgi:hypothetical protein
LVHHSMLNQMFAGYAEDACTFVRHVNSDVLTLSRKRRFVEPVRTLVHLVSKKNSLLI